MKIGYILNKKENKLYCLKDLLGHSDKELEVLAVSPYKDIKDAFICEEDILLKQRDRNYYEVVILKHGYFIDERKDIDLFGWYLEIIEFTKIYQSRINVTKRLKNVNDINLYDLKVIGNKLVDKELLKPIEQYFN